MILNTSVECRNDIEYSNDIQCSNDVKYSKVIEYHNAVVNVVCTSDFVYFEYFGEN